MCIFRCIWSLMQLQISNSSEFLLHICVIRTKRVQLKFNWVFHLLGFALFSPENVSRKFRAPCHMESEHGKCFRQAPLECKQHSMMRISIWGARSWLWRDASSLPLSHSLSFTLLHMNSIGVGKTTSFPGVGVVIGVGVGVMQQKTQQHHHQLAWHPAKPLTWARPSDPYASRPSTSWALLPVKSTVLGHVIGFLGCRLLSFSPRHHVFLSPMALVT